MQELARRKARTCQNTRKGQRNSYGEVPAFSSRINVLAERERERERKRVRETGSRTGLAGPGLLDLAITRV